MTRQITKVFTTFPFLRKVVVTETQEEKNSIEVTKDRNGVYSWTIKVYGEDLNEILVKIDEANRILKQKYPSNNLS